MFDPRPLYYSSLTTAVGGTKDTNIVDSESPYRGTNQQPPIEANNFELKPALITMVQQHHFTGHPSEDPNEHLGRFMRMTNTVKLNGGETKCNQAATLPLFIERCGSNMV